MNRNGNQRLPGLLTTGTKMLLAVVFVILSLVFGFRDWKKVTEPHAGLESGREGQVSSQQRSPASLHPRPKDSPAKISARTQIENLFREIKSNPENKEKNLRQLRRILQQNFAGQEDCWSCEGVVYFDKVDEIAGVGQARKPLGLREWLVDADEAFAEKRWDDARKFYTEALQILDERSLDSENAIKNQDVERIQNRCQQLGCR